MVVDVENFNYNCKCCDKYGLCVKVTNIVFVGIYVMALSI
jgi:hypothetical protein